MRIRTVSSPSFSSFPRNGTLMSPRATCRITGCPTQALNALSILVGPLTNQPDGRENRAAHRRSQWYREGTRLVSSYCSELAAANEVKFPWQYRSTALSGRANHRIRTPLLRSCGHDEARAVCAQDPE